MTNEAELEEKIFALSEHLDGADLFTVMSIIADKQEIELGEFLESRMAKDLILATQSNFQQTQAILKEMVALDLQIANLD